MKTGIIVCTRMQSSRIPNKCARDINGKSLLEHLHTRLLKTGINVTYAYPWIDLAEYQEIPRIILFI